MYIKIIKKCVNNNVQIVLNKALLIVYAANSLIVANNVRMNFNNMGMTNRIVPLYNHKMADKE
jgi:hypothetical protein